MAVTWIATLVAFAALFAEFGVKMQWVSGSMASLLLHMPKECKTWG